MNKFWYRCLPFFALPLGACEGCIDLEDYVVVPSDGAPSAGGAGGVGGSSSNSCSDVAGARLFVVAAALDSSVADSGACGPAARPGIDVLALEPADGTCVARAQLRSAAPEQLRVAPHLRHQAGSALAVAGTFAGSPLEFPLACGSSASVVLAAPPAVERVLFTARLRLEGSTFCTEWAHRAWSEEASDALEVQSFEQADDGSVLVAGALGGALTRFEGSDRSSAARGGAFFAAWSAGGSLESVTALATESDADDAAMAIVPIGSAPIVAGAAKLEDPGCHACSGTSHVTDAARSCPFVNDAGSDGGDASSADASSSDASSDAVADVVAEVARAEADGTPESAPDGTNAFVFTPRSEGGCARLESFGSDRVGSGDAQAIFSISKQAAGCRVYAAGAAGSDTWRIVGNDPKTLLAPGRDAIADGFLVRFGSGSALFNCAPGGADFNVRLSASGVVTGERAQARCAEGLTAAALVRDVQQGSLVLERCSTARACDATATSASLESGLGDQIVVMNLNDDGELRWHTSFGPVSIDARPRPAAAGAPLFDLTLDRGDDVYVLVKVEGPIRAHNVELSRCAQLSAENPAPGVWLVKLFGSGFGDRAGCRWARHLG